MKKLFLLIAIIFTFLSCSNEEQPEPKTFKIDPFAMIKIKPSLSKTNKLSFYSKFSSEHLTPLEIVKRATTMRFYNSKLSNSDCAAGFAGKDTISTVPAFLRYGTDIINNDGFGKPYLVPDFIYAHDIVIEIFRSNKDIDTVAYIPNIVMKTAREGIEKALIEKDTASVYVIFKNAFTFIPVTGAEYRDLVDKKLQ